MGGGREHRCHVTGVEPFLSGCVDSEPGDTQPLNKSVALSGAAVVPDHMSACRVAEGLHVSDLDDDRAFAPESVGDASLVVDVRSSLATRLSLVRPVLVPDQVLAEPYQ